MATDKPTVVGGLLSKPYPIKTRGDISRARVLPQPRSEEKAPTTPVAPATTKAPAEDSQPRGAFDYVKRRNQLMKGVSVRGRRSMSGTRRA